MKYKRLDECAYFSKHRTSDINIETYISTENMLPNKGGIEEASSIPDAKSTSGYVEDDILISNIRPYFRKIWYSNRVGACSNDILVIKAKDGYLPKFLYYVLSDNNFFNYATVTAKGTKMPRGTHKAIMKYFVPDVAVEYQKKVIDFLGQFDELIEINNNKISCLERNAEQVFIEWFVRERHASSSSEHDWIEVRIGDVCKTVNRGITPDYREEGRTVINQKCIRDSKVNMKLVRYTHAEKSVGLEKKVEKGDILINSTGTGTLGRTAIYRHDTADITVDTHVTIVKGKSKEISTYLGFYLHYIEPLLENLGKGTTNQLELSATDIKRIKIKMPKDDYVISRFHEYVWPLFEQIELLEKQNELLLAQREYVLPRVLCGKVKL